MKRIWTRPRMTTGRGERRPDGHGDHRRRVGPNASDTSSWENSLTAPIWATSGSRLTGRHVPRSGSHYVARNDVAYGFEIEPMSLDQIGTISDDRVDIAHHG